MADNLRVVIAAAGSGSRMGSKISKQYLQLEGHPVLTYSLKMFEDYAAVDEVIIVAREKDIEYCQKEIIKKYGYRKVSQVVAGGKERQDSVWVGLRQLHQDTDFVAVHDGARPLLTARLLDELLAQARQWGAAIPGVLARDTMKMVDRDGFVSQTLDRSSILAIQTPQVFRFAELWEAYQLARAEGFVSTDDASLFEKYIGRVKVVAGDVNNLKITTPQDLVVAEAILRDLA